MNFHLVAGLLEVGLEPVATGNHGADEAVGGLELLLLGGSDLGMLLGNMRLEVCRRPKEPSDSLLPAGDADVVLLAVLDLLDPLVNIPLVPLQCRSLGEAHGTQGALVRLLLEMDRGLMLGQIVSLAEAQAAGGTLNNISVTTTFTPN